MGAYAYAALCEFWKMGPFRRTPKNNGQNVPLVMGILFNRNKISQY